MLSGSKLVQSWFTAGSEWSEAGSELVRSWFEPVSVMEFGFKGMITGSAVALRCCKAHSKINRKMESSSPCKIVTPESFILKLGTREYVEDVIYYTVFDVDRFTGGFSPNR